MQFKSQNAAQFAFWSKNLRICPSLGHKVPIFLKKSEKWKVLSEQNLLEQLILQRVSQK